MKPDSPFRKAINAIEVWASSSVQARESWST